MTRLAHNDRAAAGVSDRRPTALTGRDLMHGYIAADIDADRARVARYAILCRVIAGARVQNKLAVFGMMARDAVDDVAAYRQQAIGELWEVATSLGLVDLFGITSVQDVLAAAFAGDAS
jgi:hypothetical protein